MGIFSTFTGFIYNDFMAIPLFLRDSCYDLKTGLKLKGHKDCIYPFGVDPVWHLAKNELMFFNSLKMKVAVILGILQMSLGVCLKALNSIYFKRWLDFLHEFIPQIVLLWVLFGYMDILIILKWLTNYEGKENNAPSVITMMINMGLKKGQVDSGQSLIGSESTHQTISQLLLVTALICAPWMLFAKPYILKKRHQQVSTILCRYAIALSDLLVPEGGKRSQ
jgi:V-type H+-transporting ATPase subunit a